MQLVKAEAHKAHHQGGHSFAVKALGILTEIMESRTMTAGALVMDVPGSILDTAISQQTGYDLWGMAYHITGAKADRPLAKILWQQPRRLS